MIYTIYRKSENIPMIRMGIHTHNDCGMALDNTIAAVRCGATMFHGNFICYGERCGNADLTSVIPVLFNKIYLAFFPP